MKDVHHQRLGHLNGFFQQGDNYDKDASRDKWNQSEFPNLANMMFDCDEYGHLGKRIRISSN